MEDDQFNSLAQRLERIEALLTCLTPRPVNAQEWFSIEQTAALTGLSSDHVRRHVTAGLLPVSNMGTFEKPYYRIHRKDIDEWMARRRESPVPVPRKRV